MSPSLLDPPTLIEIRNTANRLSSHIIRTPTTEVRAPGLLRELGSRARLYLKLEHFQVTGSFKARAALNNVIHYGEGARLTAVSAGNHAIAVAFAGAALNCDSKVVIVASANPTRIAAAQSYGAKVLIEATAALAFERAEKLAKEESRFFVHPFEGRRVTEATGTIAIELMEDVPKLDAIVVAIGGGGLASGIAVATKQIDATCSIYGVEPIGANVMRRSFDAGHPQTMDQVSTIADSLAAPMTTPYAFCMCQRYLDDVVTVTDDEMIQSIKLCFRELKLALEPAGAAAVAAVMGPLRSRLIGKRIAIIVCGSNIDATSFCKYLNSQHKLDIWSTQ